MSGMSISSQQNCRHHSQDLHLCLELNIGHVTAQVSMVPREIRMADFPPSALLLGGCCMGLGSRSHRFSLLRRPGSQPLLQCCWHLSPCKQGQQWQGKDSCRTVPSLQGTEQQQSGTCVRSERTLSRSRPTLLSQQSQLVSLAGHAPSPSIAFLHPPLFPQSPAPQTSGQDVGAAHPVLCGKTLLRITWMSP